ncbi:phosphatase PAP2 family protein [Arsenicicoccus sp. oral taxon 190]|uniref:phosphatase PAP2 family protein n=1 Tax=Arsenicicoccus sp. oral taxon 190 TaxID=1658671 RepID=UPI00067A10CE|nr:phosphatase PAP2 family protein [Arsenicicoccus sp. oral taxon 190]AKT51411.1 hypothetical protein ADJ73_08935 [Arsenicicoccus sp. oral taxon 190]
MDLQRRPFEETIGERDLTHWRTPAGRSLARAVTRASTWTLGTWVLLATLALGLLVTLTLTAGAAETYEAVVAGDGVAGLDRPVLDLALSHRSAGLDSALTTFTDIGGPVGMPVLSLALVAIAALTWRSWAPLLLTVLAAAGSLAMTILGKQLVGRVRPPLADAVPPYEHSASFPSGHTLNTTVIIGVLTYLLLTHLHRKRTRTLVLVLAVLWVAAMGLSRVFLGHHWFTDVVCGWLLGLAWVTVLVTCHRLWLTLVRHHSRRTDERVAA